MILIKKNQSTRGISKNKKNPSLCQKKKSSIKQMVIYFILVSIWFENIKYILLNIFNYLKIYIFNIINTIFNI